MIRFFGNIELKVDEKGRVAVPSQFRRQLVAALEKRLILRKDIFHNCLTLYPESVWSEELNELRALLSNWNPTHQLVFRQFVSDVEIITIDPNGRMLIPKRYMQLCGIHNDVRFIGVDKKMEIWAKENTEQPFMTPDAFANALEEIMRLNNKQ